MNGHDDLRLLLRRVLTLADGDRVVLREPHLIPCTVHRYRDGWTVLADDVLDRLAVERSSIGWHFKFREDIVAYLVGTMREEHVNYLLFWEGE